MSVPLSLLVLIAVVAGALVLLRHRGSRLVRPGIDPFALKEPWRHHVSDAQSAQRRYIATVKSIPSGPLHDRLAEIQRAIQKGVDECWQIAKRGADLDAVVDRLNVQSLNAQLARASTDEERDSLQRQVESAARIQQLRDGTDERLRMLNVRLGELVTQAAEVSVGTDTTHELGAGIDDVVTQLEALRLAVEDFKSAPGDP